MSDKSVTIHKVSSRESQVHYGELAEDSHQVIRLVVTDRGGLALQRLGARDNSTEILVVPAAMKEAFLQALEELTDV